MRHCFRIAVASVVLLSSTALAEPSPQARREIQQLMDGLSNSQCQFQRNGTWHDRQDARQHLQRKYDYLLKRNLADTAEQFIDRAGSRSSVSGKPYRVRCPGQSEMAAGDWFRARLKALRSSGGTAR